MRELSYIKRGIALFLSFWMLFTSIGFSIDFHYCEGDLVNWSILGEAEKCDHHEENLTEKSCCSIEVKSCQAESKELEKTDCCSSDYAKFQLDENFGFSSQNFEISQPTILFLTSFAYSNTITKESVVPFYTNNSPPILKKRGLTFIQTFLI